MSFQTLWKAHWQCGFCLKILLMSLLFENTPNITLIFFLISYIMVVLYYVTFAFLNCSRFFLGFNYSFNTCILCNTCYQPNWNKLLTIKYFLIFVSALKRFFEYSKGCKYDCWTTICHLSQFQVVLLPCGC